MTLRPLPVLALIPGLLLALAARADVPSANDSTVPDLLVVAARGGSGAPDPAYPFTIVVRHFGGRPFSDASVVLDFTGCTDLKLCSDQGDPNVLMTCQYPSIRALSDINGMVTFHVVGGGLNNGALPGPTGPALNVFADGVLLKTVRVAVLDQGGFDGLTGNDHSVWLADFFSGQPFARSDYDGDGALTGNDLSLWLGAFFSGGSVLGCGSARCP
jgi:hypothetical protein